MTTNTLTHDRHTLSRPFRRQKTNQTWMLDLRRKAWRFFEEIPWPTGGEETWRRTKLTGFKLEDYQPFAARPGCGAAG